MKIREETRQEIVRLRDGISAIPLEPADIVVLRLRAILDRDQRATIARQLRRALGNPPNRLLILDGGTDLGVLKHGSSRPQANTDR